MTLPVNTVATELQQNAFSFEGTDYVFHINNPNDAIQRCHAEGRLFDYRELVEMAKHIKDGDLIGDIGTNVGNHAVFFSKQFPNSTVMVFEPGEEAIRILTANLDANDCGNVDRQFIGFGLSDTAEDAWFMPNAGNNLGGSRIVEISDDEMTGVHRKRLTSVPLLTGDQAFAGLTPGMLKIDVEGLELKVLAGLEQTFERCRPVLFIEVQIANVPAFKQWMTDHNYTPVWTDTHYKSVVNFLVTPS